MSLSIRKLFIINNDLLVSLVGLNNIGDIQGDWINISENDNLISLDALYGADYIGNYLAIYGNLSLSTATAYDLVTQWSPPNGVFNGTTFIEWNGVDGADSDNDGVYDTEDNCPSMCNSNQSDADGDGIGDVCDPDPGCGGCGGSCEIEC